MKKFLSNVTTFFKQGVYYLQSIILAVVALMHWNTELFWIYMTASIVVGGLGEIINEIKKK
jgi:hypothetical protein